MVIIDNKAALLAWTAEVNGQKRSEEDTDISLERLKAPLFAKRSI